MVLVDTSVWIDHFRNNNQQLSRSLEHEGVAVHPYVAGELASGNLRERDEILTLLHALPSAMKADDTEVLFLIESSSLMRRGISLIDMHLLASCQPDTCLLWTHDKRLAEAADNLKISYT